ncbi:hypothetical protein [Varunaivibrio sulfuroxidans]|uniref:Putative AphA-like transcriptional regulator n=1 Tax=Varunaivibrio sulfuroxidans TaxID=1773489 RepID=A0A4R3J4P9_9PROT|nr:hypothetical protein [Varunaivibrio sulfuroxidans]TCS60849.1 putative AphA-like transcriptional regulator [Varunaivibrio sulfuroxidans]WES31737.1 hypothetical protein P3M64_05040 [Varunaivibrio sulfuroxidans]
MYADNTLTPKEAVRLCALGTLAQSKSPMRYSVLANAIRHFTSRITGPSLDVMGTSVELLRYEGLVEAVTGTGMEDDAELALTEQGRQELRLLMTASIRSSASEFNKLIVTLKFRFLNLLNPDEQNDQAELLIEAAQTELARIEDLRAHHADDGGFLVAWLDHDISQIERNLKWLFDFRDRIKNNGSATT